MIASLFGILTDSLLPALRDRVRYRAGLANLAGGLVMTPVLRAIITAAVPGAWVALRLRGAAP